MRLTYLDAKKILAQYAGRGGLCVDNPDVDLFTRGVLDYMLISGAYGSIRKFTFQAVNGTFTIPYELEVPTKVKIDNIAGQVWDRWFEFHSSKELGPGCVPASEALFEDPNYYPTIYDGPLTGFKVGIQGTCLEDEDAHVIIQGKDPSGREIFTTHKGEQVTGEYLSIVKNRLTVSEVIFGSISGVYKTKTKGYAQLYAINPSNNKRTYLSDYSPIEEKPAYRRFKLTGSYSPLAKVEVLGNIRLKPAYSDLDFIPFDNTYIISLAGQAINKQYNEDIQGAQATDQTMMTMIGRENTHKRVQNGQPIDVYQGLSPGRIRNMVR